MMRMKAPAATKVYKGKRVTSKREEFQKIADNLDGKYVLDADIDDWMSGNSTSYTPIGTPDMPFTGELDGAGHSISGTLLFTGSDEAWGFFDCNEGYVCAYNEGTISGVNLSGSNLYYRTFDKDTAADGGLVCGYQTASAVLDNVTLDYCNIDLDSFGEFVGNVAPTVYLGMLIGEAEGGIIAWADGNVTVDGCVIDVEYNLTGGGAILHGAEDTDGFYNNP